MKAFDYDAVAYDCDIYCVECLPDGVDIEDVEVQPIFASDEVQSALICSNCHGIHDYMSVLDNQEHPTDEESND